MRTNERELKSNNGIYLIATDENFTETYKVKINDEKTIYFDGEYQEALSFFNQINNLIKRLNWM